MIANFVCSCYRHLEKSTTTGIEFRVHCWVSMISVSELRMIVCFRCVQAYEVMMSLTYPPFSEELVDPQILGFECINQSTIICYGKALCHNLCPNQKFHLIIIAFVTLSKILFLSPKVRRRTLRAS